MITNQQRSWLDETYKEALASAHVWPQMAACEAALESGFGSSKLARVDLNLFGMKQHEHPTYGTVQLPTREFLDGQWEIVEDNFVKYDSLEECFDDRMATLKRLAPHYAHYAAAISAPSAIDYVNEVSKSWSTDPARASKVIAIYNDYTAQPSPGVSKDLCE